MPEISVLMAAYNAEATVSEAISSVLTQSFDDLELIVVNDGSTDRTAEVLDAIVDPRIRVLHQKNRGPAAARNYAASVSSSPWLACIDADDIWLPEKLAHQHCAVTEAHDAVLTYGWAEVADSKGKVLYNDQRPTHTGDVFERLLASNFIVSGSNTLMSRAAFNKANGFDESLRAVEDWDLHARLAYRATVVCTPHLVVQYRLHQNSLSTNLDLMEKSWWQASNKLFLLEHAPKALQARSAAAFYIYLATRALQTCSGKARLVRCLRYIGTALRHAPASLPKVLLIASPLGAIRGWFRR